MHDTDSKPVQVAWVVSVFYLLPARVERAVTNLTPGDLLGYLLGALDATEAQHVKNAIDTDIQIQKQIEEMEAMLPLLHQLAPPPATDDSYPRSEDFAPPALARRTLEFVAQQGLPERPTLKIHREMRVS